MLNGDEATAEDFDRLMAVNARGTMLCYKYAGKQMIAQGHGGRIIGTFSYCTPPFFIGNSRIFSGACSIAGKQGQLFLLRCAATRLTLHEQAIALARRTAQASLLFAVSHNLLARPLP